MITFIIGFILAAFTIFFAFQNNDSVTVNFLQYEVTSSLALIIIASMCIGFLISIIIFLPRAIADSWKARLQNREIAKLKKRLNDEPIQYEAPGLGAEGEGSLEVIE
jgi:uncharacterized integral membrane protein